MSLILMMSAFQRYLSDLICLKISLVEPNPKMINFPTRLLHGMVFLSRLPPSGRGPESIKPLRSRRCSPCSFTPQDTGKVPAPTSLWLRFEQDADRSDGKSKYVPHIRHDISQHMSSSGWSAAALRESLACCTCAQSKA